MGLQDVAGNYEPKENQEFGGKKKLVGDAVCQMELSQFQAKTGKFWYKLEGTVIHCVPDPKGRETTVEPGDEITKLYDPDNDEKMTELMDDLFTAGVTYSKNGDSDTIFGWMSAATTGKLFYIRTWAKDKPKDKQEEGKPTYWQNIKILSSNKITEENSTPQMAF